MALEVDAPTQQLDKPPRHAQTQSGSADRTGVPLLHLPEGVIDPVLMLSSNADAGVPHLEDDRSVAVSSGAALPDLPSFRDRPHRLLRERLDEDSSGGVSSSQASRRTFRLAGS